MIGARGERNRRIRGLRQIPLLAGCTEKELARVDRLGAEVDLKPGRTLTREGAEGYEVFMVRAGVAVATRGARRVGAIRVGSIAGELALLDGTVRTATVVAAAPMRVVVFTAKEFEELLAVAPCIEDGVRRIAAERRTQLGRPGGDGLDFRPRLEEEFGAEQVRLTRSVAHGYRLPSPLDVCR